MSYTKLKRESEHHRRRRDDIEDDEFTRTNVIDKLLDRLNENDFDPGETARFMARQRDSTGETEWRSRVIEEYAAMGERVKLIEELSRENTTDIMFKVGHKTFEAWKKEQDEKLNRWLGYICVGIGAIAAVYGGIIFFVAERVFK